MTGQFATNKVSVAEFAGAGLDRNEIAWLLNIGPSYVDMLARHAGVKVNAPSDNRIERLRKLASRGLTRREAAREIGCRYERVSTLAKQHGIDFVRQKYAGAETKISPRAQSMAALYKNGNTLKEIGESFGVTRERVRQVLAKHFGMTAIDGGQHFRAEENRRRIQANRDQRSLSRWGCNRAEYDALRSMKKPTRAFASQKRNANERGISWELTLWQWWQIWQQSGRWPDRGRGYGYQMCRHGDQGPYSVDNVYIASGATNMQDYWISVKSGVKERKYNRQAASPEHSKAVAKAAAERYRKTPKYKLRLQLRRQKLPKEQRDAIVAAQFGEPEQQQVAA